MSPNDAVQEGPSEDEVFDYLDELRESGVTNMFGARAYIIREFSGMDNQTVAAHLTKWMRTFSQRHPQTEPQT